MTEDATDPDAPGGGPEALVLAAFEDPEPLTAGEVAAATGVDADEAEAALDGLVTAGRLGRKTVGEGITLWYPTPGGGNGSAAGPEPETKEAPPDPGIDPDPEADTADWSPDEVTVRGGGSADDGEESAAFDEGAVEAAVADLDVPGTSEMMRDWRRAAVRAAFDHLHANGSATSGAIVEAVYSGHRAGYSDRDAWWAFVAPRLETLPGVDREGEEWTFTGRE